MILAIGWKQELPFIDREIRSMLVEPDGQYKLYRMIVNPELPGFGFVGFNSSLITTLSAELSANWLARWFSGDLQVMATQAEMHEDIARTLNWKRRCRPVASTFNGLCIAPYHHFQFDELMKDMGARRKPRNPIVANLLPISPRRYASLLSTAVDRHGSDLSLQFLPVGADSQIATALAVRELVLAVIFNDVAHFWGRCACIYILGPKHF